MSSTIYNSSTGRAVFAGGTGGTQIFDATTGREVYRIEPPIGSATYTPVSGSTVSTALSPGVILTAGTVTSVTLTSVECAGIEGEIRFTGGEGISVTLPDTAKVLGALPEFAAGKSYVLNALDGYVVGAEVAE